MLKAVLAASLWLGAAGSVGAHDTSDEVSMTVRAAFDICGPMVLSDADFGPDHPILAAKGAVSRGAPEFQEGEIEIFEVPSPSGAPVLLTLNLVDRGCELEPSAPFLDEFKLAARDRGWVEEPVEAVPGMSGRSASWISSDYRANIWAFEDQGGGRITFQRFDLPPDTVRRVQEATRRNASRSLGEALVAGVEVVCPAIDDNGMGSPTPVDRTEEVAAQRDALLQTEVAGGFGSSLTMRHRPSDGQVGLISGGLCMLGVDGSDAQSAIAALRTHLDGSESGWAPTSLTERDVYRHVDGRFLRFFGNQQAEGVIVASREVIEAFAPR